MRFNNLVRILTQRASEREREWISCKVEEEIKVGEWPDKEIKRVLESKLLTNWVLV